MSKRSTNYSFLTNDYSIVSKHSAVKCGYFRDTYIEKIFDQFPKLKSIRRTSLVNRGYAARLIAIDKQLESHDGTDCYIILGAGYDTLSFRSKSRNRAGSLWIEIDLPQVVKAKVKMIQDCKLLDNDSRLKQIDKNIFSSLDGLFFLIACDLTNDKLLLDCLSFVIHKIASNHLFKKATIINEVCLCYIKTSDVIQILHNVIKLLVQFGYKRVDYIGVEQMKPISGSQFSRVMHDHFTSMGHPLRHFVSETQIKALISDCLNGNVKVTPLHKIFRLEPELMMIPTINDKPFDEFEEMDAFLSHYAIVEATFNESFRSRPTQNKHTKGHRLSSIDEEQIRMVAQQADDRVKLIDSSIRRFGHSSCKLANEDSYLVSGGFGIDSIDGLNTGDQRPHMRLADCRILIRKDDRLESHPVSVENFPVDSVCLDRMHGQVNQLAENQLLFFNGGRQNPAKHSINNVHFLAELDEDYIMKSKYIFETCPSSVKWRHRLAFGQIGGHEMIQIGGLGIGHISMNCPVISWNYSSGLHSIIEVPDADVFRRHTFGLDQRNSNVFIIGGLQANNEASTDKPIREENGAIIWDLRDCNKVTKICANWTKLYGANFNFINDYQLIRMGGISTLDGIELSNSIDLIDIRNYDSIRYSISQAKLSSRKAPVMLTNSTSVISESRKELMTTGGGGSYFTFGTHFCDSHMIYSY